MGRKKKPPGEHYRTPARQAGRIPADEWALIQRAARVRGKTTTAAIREVMLRWAKRVMRDDGM